MTLDEYWEILDNLTYFYSVTITHRELAEKVYHPYIQQNGTIEKKDYPLVIIKYIEYAENKEKEAMEL